MSLPAYEDSLALLHEWTRSESLRRHAYAVEAAMAEYADFFSEDVDLYRATGLLHDMDYEKNPSTDKHPFVGVEVLRDLGYPPVMLDAILGHATYSGVTRTTNLARSLFAVDELAGFVTAVAYVRPTGLVGLAPKSVKKKLKDKAFAKAVSREDISVGAEELGVPFDEHVARVISGMTRSAARLGFEKADG